MEEEPILEVLSFSFEKDLSCGDGQPGSSTSGGMDSSSSENQASKVDYHSSVLLGESTKTPCLLPGCEYICPPFITNESKGLFLEHLLVQHKFVIDSVNEIANLHK